MISWFLYLNTTGVNILDNVPEHQEVAPPTPDSTSLDEK